MKKTFIFERIKNRKICNKATEFDGLWWGFWKYNELCGSLKKQKPKHEN